MPSSVRLSCRLAALALTACSATLLADDSSNATDYGPLPAIGSSDVSLADPLVTRPSTTPCVVPLFTDLAFDDYSPRDFTYTPPADCAGPWAKVVLSLDLSVTAGVQYDRTGTIWVGGVNVFFGTTAEPKSNLAPSWHVERDLTDYSTLLTTTQAGASSSATSSTAPTPASSTAARACSSTPLRRATRRPSCRIRSSRSAPTRLAPPST